MRARHKALGGASSQSKIKDPGESVSSSSEKVYGNPEVNVAKEAKEKKRGGKIHGHHAKHRLDKRARGGRTGSDKSPFASSAHTKPSGKAKEPLGAGG